VCSLIGYGRPLLTLCRYLYIMKQTDYTGYDIEMMTKIKLIDAGPEGYVEWELPITGFYSNMNNVMHGGAAGVILE
jgi:acyl-coenzyme A thioesterase 13